MAISYDLYPTPHPDNKGTEDFHVRAVLDNPKSDKNLIDSITQKCTLTPSDIRGVLTALSESIKDELLEGRRVHLEGIGYLYPTITSKKNEEKKRISAPQIELKAVSFRAERDMINEMRTKATFTIAKKKVHSSEHSLESISTTLKEYLNTHDEIDSKGFRELCELTKSTAYKSLKELEDNGIIVKIGNNRAPRFVLKK